MAARASRRFEERGLRKPGPPGPGRPVAGPLRGCRCGVACARSLSPATARSPAAARCASPWRGLCFQWPEPPLALALPINQMPAPTQRYAPPPGRIPTWIRPGRPGLKTRGVALQQLGARKARIRRAPQRRLSWEAPATKARVPLWARSAVGDLRPHRALLRLGIIYRHFT